MPFRQFSQNQESASLQNYVSILDKHLRRALPHDKAAQIAQETAAHLSDRVDDLVDSGISRSEAEVIALSGFGPVTPYARQATLNAYGDRTSARWRLAGRIAVANLLAFQVVFPLLDPNRFFSNIGIDIALALAGVGCLLLIPLAAACYRLPQTRTLLAFFVAAVVSVGLGAGVLYVPNSDSPLLQQSGWEGSPQTLHGGPGVLRGDHSQEIATRRADCALLYQETALLMQGQALYRQGKPIPAMLRQSGRYVVPRAYALTSNRYYEGMDEMDASAFKESDMHATYLSRQKTALARARTVTVLRRDSAERLWQTEAPSWLRWKNRRVAYRNAEIATLENATTAPLGFNLGAATFFASHLVRLSAPLLVLEWLFAHLGRWAWCQLRNRRRGQVA